MSRIKRAWEAITGKAASTEKSASNVAMNLIRPHQATGDRNLVSLSSEVWAYTCATYIANAIASAGYGVYAVTNPGQRAIRVQHRPVKSLPRNPKAKQAAEVAEIISHPLLDLLRTPNPRQTSFEFLSETQNSIDTTGDAYWLVIPDAIGRPDELHVLQSQRVKLVVDRQTGEIQYYEYNRGCAQQLRIPIESVVHFRTPNIRDEYTGMGCLEAAWKSATLLESMTDLELALNQNMAVPSIIVKYVDGALKSEDRKRLEAEWNAGLQGIRKAGRVRVADNQFEVQTIGLSPREMQFLSGRKWSREEVCAAYRVPISMVTSESVNRANAEAGAYQFARYGIKPRLELLEQTINRWLVPMYGEDRIFVEFENPVPQDRDFELRKLQAAQAMNAYEANELTERLDAI